MVYEQWSHSSVHQPNVEEGAEWYWYLEEKEEEEIEKKGVNYTNNKKHQHRHQTFTTKVGTSIYNNGDDQGIEVDSWWSQIQCTFNLYRISNADVHFSYTNTTEKHCCT